jgi:hypothetical protein
MGLNRDAGQQRQRPAAPRPGADPCPATWTPIQVRGWVHRSAIPSRQRRHDPVYLLMRPADGRQGATDRDDGVLLKYGTAALSSLALGSWLVRLSAKQDSRYDSHRHREPACSGRRPLPKVRFASNVCGGACDAPPNPTKKLWTSLAWGVGSPFPDCSGFGLH